METAELYELYQQHPAVQTDTRKLKKGDIFFALSGSNFNGNAFAKEALDKGASFAIIDDVAYSSDERCILVENVLVALQQLADYHRRQFAIPFIAITGSNGKTTTKELVTAVLSKKMMTHATEGNLNNHIGIPLTLLKIKDNTAIAVIEMGANHQREIAGYCEIVEPTHGIITNCGKAHIEGFGGVEGVRKGKGELYDYLRKNNGIIFRNADLDYLESMASGIEKQITYGSHHAEYTGTAVMKGAFLSVEAIIKNEAVVIDTNLVGDYNFHNVMTAVAVGSYFGVAMSDIVHAIGEYLPDNSRSQWKNKGTNHLILDAYNANPTSMQAAITNFAATDLPNKMLWIGGMKEMGKDERQEHELLVALIAKYRWKDVILVGNEFKDIQDGYAWFEDSKTAATHIKNSIPENSSILVKGSRGSRMELMVDALPE